MGVQATLSTGQGMAEQTPAPMQRVGGGDQEKCCTLGGTVTDPSGAVVVNASITITNIATNRAIPLKTDQAGRFTAKDLGSGKYDVMAEANGFKTTVVKGVEVNAGKAARLNIRLEIGNWGGCCEYAAAPMKTLEDYTLKIKPFTYSVGEGNDGGTLSGLAKLVAHNSGVTPAGAKAGDESSPALSFGGSQPACARRGSNGCDTQ